MLKADDRKTERFLCVAELRKRHGIQGEARANSMARASLDFLIGAKCWVVPPLGKTTSSRCLALQELKDGQLLITLSSVAEDTTCAPVDGHKVLMRTQDVPQDFRTKLREEDRSTQWLGYRVLTVTGEELGSVTVYHELIANDCIEVAGAYGTELVPVIDHVVVDVDDDRSVITIDLPRGIFEEYDRSCGLTS